MADETTSAAPQAYVAPAKPYLTVDDVDDHPTRLGVQISVHGVRRLAALDRSDPERLPSFMVTKEWLIHRDDLNRWLDGCRQQASQATAPQKPARTCAKAGECMLHQALKRIQYVVPKNNHHQWKQVSA